MHTDNKKKPKKLRLTRYKYVITPFLLTTGERIVGPEPIEFYLTLVGIASVFLLVILVIGMLIARRKREHSTLWFPEGFFLKKEPSSNKNRREPVGQDALGMK